MLYVALAELGLIALTIFGSWSAVRSQSRAHARREDLLLNQALHAAGRPWQPAPADTFIPERAPLWDEDGELALSQHYARFTTSPEQEP